jgi:4,5-DOPA dioxygenase extradiol
MNMKFPALFVNHGGGPLPLMGRQPALAQHMKEIVKQQLPPREPKAIVILSAHYEADPIEITSAKNPSMLYDYHGFPPETYEYQYPAPGSPELASEIQSLLTSNNIDSKLNATRGFDHGVFIPLMLMYPEATIPVVCVSLHKSLDISTHLKIGSALAPLLDDDILVLGSGYTFHNMGAFFGPTQRTVQASMDFNEWIKDTLLKSDDSTQMLDKLKKWKSAPGALLCHPREEHLLPLFMVAAAGTTSKTNAKLIYDTIPKEEDVVGGSTDHAVTGYLFA